MSMVAVLLVLAASVAESTVIVVGGNTGWTTGFDYDAWALAQNIQPRVGDSLGKIDLTLSLSLSLSLSLILSFWVSLGFL